MLKDVNSDKIRCFVIADDYRWHILTDNSDEFLQASLAYIKLMNESGKENHYYFKNIFLERSEYFQIKKNMAYVSTATAEQKKKEADLREQVAQKKSHLRLVVSNP